MASQMMTNCKRLVTIVYITSLNLNIGIKEWYGLVEGSGNLLEWFFTRMNSIVLSQVTLSGKFLLTISAIECVAIVDPQMSPKSVQSVEFFKAG